ncbi:MAG: hypothetical protein ACRDE2_07645 [Chitinophagaceae bacterium]
MKKLLITSLFITGIIFMGIHYASAQGRGHFRHGDRGYGNYSFYQGYSQDLPPGQAKKIYGMQSARYFAHERNRERFHEHGDYRHWHRDDDQGDGYYQVPYYQPVYTQPGVVINAHIHIPLR